MVKGQSANISTQLNGNTAFNAITAPDAANGTGDKPKAYLNILFFDERFNFVGDGSTYLRVTQPGDAAPQLVLPNIKAPKNGYVFIYVSNESSEHVYFDNLNVSLTRGRIIEEDHYYAYGLKIAAISSVKLGDTNEGLLDNKNLYNDKELFDDADLDWYDYGFRNYDAQIGRFTQLDPLTDDYVELTPYQYASCEPVANIDIDGLEAGTAIKAGFDGTFNILNDVVVTAASKVAKMGPSTGQGTKLLNKLKSISKVFIKSTIRGTKAVVTHGGALILGAVNAWTSDQMLGAGRINAEENGLTNSKGVAFQIGQTFGDMYSVATGSGEVTGGTVGEIASLGFATPVAVPVAIHGATAVGTGIYHLASGRIVYSTSGNKSASTQPKKYPKDFATKNTKNYSATYKSEREARTLARTKLGKNPIKVEPGKWRSVDGKWQYRAKPGDIADKHIHIEELNSETGEVLQNYHLRWK